MPQQDELFSIEEEFCTGAPSAIAATSPTLSSWCSGPAGVLLGDAIVSSLDSVSPWSEVLKEEHRLLAKHADNTYIAHASSAYARAGGWELAFRQQATL